jgi:hypothetical protein
MKKDQMQQVIDDQVKEIHQQAKTIADYVREIQKLEYFVQVERKNAISDTEDKYYEQWKQMNAKFMKRYIEELIMHDELTVDFESDYGGYFTMKVCMNGKHLNEFSGQINMNRNSLEE